jgi:hypothetical protein
MQLGKGMAEADSARMATAAASHVMPVDIVPIFDLWTSRIARCLKISEGPVKKTCPRPRITGLDDGVALINGSL